MSQSLSIGINPRSNTGSEAPLYCRSSSRFTKRGRTRLEGIALLDLGSAPRASASRTYWSQLDDEDMLFCSTRLTRARGLEPNS